MPLKCKTSLQPLIPWPGGKRRMAKKLTSLFPNHSTYVEPFAGGASVFFHKPLAKKNILGDADGWVIKLYDDVRKGKLSKCDGGIKVSKGLFKRSLNSSDACKKVAAAALSYHGDRKTYGAVSKEGRVVLADKLGNQGCYAQKLKSATLKVGDFATTMRKNDSKDTVHFLDPPWPMDYTDKYHAHGGPKRGKSRDKGSFGGAMDPEYVKKVSNQMKGTVVVIYNWTPELAKTFSGPGWKTMKIKATTQHGRGGLVSRPNLVAIKKAKSA
jgi:DNA adenine methylase